ncbi:glycoside hydrolase [Bacillus thuringiensis]|uniref:Glycoside hydrolase n=1 Tax=Bacillus thuringiensis TaxID=1428 RepID=A0A9X7B3G9_BACTU|nr:bifunctional lytic transglycosylase/C40 family peptidase [Bacillus thuringiensis]PFT98687.1 glycoside hydrolase [Bacillus thuringiensis]
MYIKTTVTVVRNWKPILIGILILLSCFTCMMWGGGERPQTPMGVGSATVSPEVMKWEPLVRKHAQTFGMEAYIPLALALIQQESNGTLRDVMQAAEGAFNTKYPKVQNGIPDPDYSIWCGIQELKHSLELAGVTGPTDIERIKLSLQSYNFGTGFFYFVQKNGGAYTLDLAKQFALAHNGGRTQCGFRSPYCYGDVSYVEKVLKNYQIGGTSGTGAIGDELFQKVMGEATKYKGQKYVWGGSNPTQGFDCSGLIQWTYHTAGIQLNRTAQLQWNQTKRISAEEAKPGDLVFFHSTYPTDSYITHVGIYQGNMQMFHAGDPLNFADLKTPFWQQHLAGFGRVQ